jgi:hypothetical protein
MASRMVSSYGPQATQANEEPPPESSLDLTLTQHPRDEEPELRKVRARLEVEPPRTWYYRISPNSRTLVILLQVDLASGDEPETVCEGCYETKDTSIFAWSSIPVVGHSRNPTLAKCGGEAQHFEKVRIWSPPGLPNV